MQFDHFQHLHNEDSREKPRSETLVLSTVMRCGRSGPEAGRSAVRTVRACGPDGPRMRRAV
jgi:hypothetical protein